MSRKVKIYNNIHVLRAEKRMSQQELAEQIGVTRLTVIALEKGNYNPTLELVFRITNFFEKTVEEIFSYEFFEE